MKKYLWIIFLVLMAEFWVVSKVESFKGVETWKAAENILSTNEKAYSALEKGNYRQATEILEQVVDWDLPLWREIFWTLDSKFLFVEALKKNKSPQAEAQLKKLNLILQDLLNAYFYMILIPAHDSLSIWEMNSEGLKNTYYHMLSELNFDIVRIKGVSEILPLKENWREIFVKQEKMAAGLDLLKKSYPAYPDDLVRLIWGMRWRRNNMRNLSFLVENRKQIPTDILLELVKEFMRTTRAVYRYSPIRLNKKSNLSHTFSTIQNGNEVLGLIEKILSEGYGLHYR